MLILVAHSVVVGDRESAEHWAPLLRHSARLASYLNDPDPRSIQHRAEHDVPLRLVLWHRMAILLMIRGTLPAQREKSAHPSGHLPAK
ncbi:MAG TPA: hypothetical protein VGL94_09710 [Ktedonobacteraceae bacterium]